MQLNLLNGWIVMNMASLPLLVSWNSFHHEINNLMVEKGGLWKRSLPGCSGCLFSSFWSANPKLLSVLCSTVLLSLLPRLPRLLPTLGVARMKLMPIYFLSPSPSVSAFVSKWEQCVIVSVDHTSTHCYCLNLNSTFVLSPLFSQWCFNNNRPFLGHQSRPARLLHPLLASKPRGRLFNP